MIGHKISQYQTMVKLLFQRLEHRGIAVTAPNLTFTYLMQQLKLVAVGASLDADASLHYQQDQMARKVLQDVGLIKGYTGVDIAGITPKGQMFLRLYEEGWLKLVR